MHNKSKYCFLNIAVGTAAILAVIFIAKSYMDNMEKNVESEISQTLSEISTKSVLLIQEKVNNDIAMLEGIAASIANSDVDITDDAMLQKVANRTDNSKFNLLTVVDLDGNTHNSDIDESINIASRDYFQRAVQGEVTVTDVISSIRDESKIIIISVPIYRDQNIIGVLNGRYAISELEYFLDIPTFSGKGHSYIASKEGEIFLRSDNPDTDPNFANIITDFADVQFDDTSDLNALTENLKNGKAGIIFYTWKGSQRIMDYRPVGVGDWYMLSVVPREVVTTQSSYLFQQAIFLVAGLMLIIVFVILYIFERQRRSKQRIANAHQEIKTLYETIPCGIFRCLDDDELTITFANDNFYQFLGYSKQVFSQKYDDKLSRIISTQDLQMIQNKLDEHISFIENIEFELALPCADGHIRWALLNLIKMLDEMNRVFWYVTFLDITNIKEMQDQLHQNQDRFEIILDQTQDMIFEWNIENKSLYLSKNYDLKFKYKPDGVDFPESALKDDLIKEEDKKEFLNIFQSVLNGERYASGDVRICNQQQAYIWCKINACAVYDQNHTLTRVIGIITDIHNEKIQLREMMETAKRDSLTKLFNKGVTSALIEDYICMINKPGALLIIDVDNFKNINDTMGHMFGDAVLEEISQELKSLFRNTDIIGRIGGDEFAIFLGEIGEKNNIEKKVIQVIDLFKKTYVKDKEHIPISGSIGVACYPDDGTTFAQLYEKADLAMYNAKMNGKNRYSFYTEDMVPDEILTGHRNEDEQLFKENQIDMVCKLFYECASLEEALARVFNLLGRSLFTHRLSIYEYGEQESLCKLYYEWCLDDHDLSLYDTKYVLEEGAEDLFINQHYVYEKGSISSPYERLLHQNTHSALLYRVKDYNRNHKLIIAAEYKQEHIFHEDEIESIIRIFDLIALFILREK